LNEKWASNKGWFSSFVDGAKDVVIPHLVITTCYKKVTQDLRLGKILWNDL